MDQNTLRILDANLNRAREAVRVIEDFFRFHNESMNSKPLKDLRRDIGRLGDLPGPRLLASRHAEKDPGRRIHETVSRKGSEVLTANFKRVQEALRSIEEWAKKDFMGLSNRAGRLRFRAYDIEKSITLPILRGEKIGHVRLCLLLTRCLCLNPWKDVIRDVLEAGIDMIQLREPGMSDKETLTAARFLVRSCRKTGVRVIINNRADIARLSQADGVHLGRGDLSVAQAREILGEEKIIGRTSHTAEQFHKATKECADYVSVGPMFPSTVKPGLSARGFHYLPKHEQTPFFCIGGITRQNLKKLKAKGVQRVAVCSDILSDPNPGRAVRKYHRLLK